MKAKHWLAKGIVGGMLTTFGVITTPAEEIKLGDTTATVLRELGKPQGRITSGIHEVYLYDRGKVELKSGLVTSVELISAEAAVARRIAQEKHLQEAGQRAREAQERRQVEGNRIFSERLADTAFRAQSAGEQLAYWELFQQQYPEIDIGAVSATLTRQYQAEMEQARVREQLADLQQRTAAAEARALRAERAADEAYWARPTVTYLASPWVQSYTPYCPPTPSCTITHPLPIKPTNTITPTPRKIPAVKIHKSGTSPLSTGVTVNVKSGTLCK